MKKKMKKRMPGKACSLALAATALVAGLAACSSEEHEAAAPAAEPSRYITVSPNIGEMTRTVMEDGTQKFASGDKISVYAWTGSASAVPADLVVNNSENTFDGTAWNASPQMLWKNPTDEHYFLGIYPAREVTDFTADSYTLDEADQESSDLLVAADKTAYISQNTQGGIVPLTFDHAMAKLVVNLSFRNQWGGTPTVSSVKATAQATASVNYITATGTVVSASGSQREVDLPATAKNTAYASIMIPQTGFRKIVIAIESDGTTKEYTFTHSTDITLQSGKYTTVNLIVGRDQITLGKVSINDWTAGGTIDGGEAQEILPLGDKALADAASGDYYMNDGTLVDSKATLTEAQKAGCIAIVFDPNLGADIDYSSTGIGQVFCNGYAIALQNAYLNSVMWSTSNTETGADDGSAGYTNTLTLSGLDGFSSATYPAAYYVTIYDSVVQAAPATSCGWFLPSRVQLYAALSDASVRDAITALGGTLQGNYWSSTEYDTDNAYSVYLGSDGTVGVTTESKSNARDIRAVLAF